jgi:hypothetical protein
MTEPPAGVPEAARANTADGATAFVRYFLSQGNKAYGTLDAAELDGLYSPSCKACASVIQTISDWKNRGYHYQGNFATPTVVTISAFPTAGPAKVLVKSENPPGRLINSQGSVVENIPPETSSSSVFVEYQQGAWRLQEIKVAA